MRFLDKYQFKSWTLRVSEAIRWTQALCVCLLLIVVILVLVKALTLFSIHTIKTFHWMYFFFIEMSLFGDKNDKENLEIRTVQ